jgi:hypothetical protein
METIVQFKEACLAGAKLFGWDGKPEVTVAVNNQVSVEVTDAKRAELIRLREEALTQNDEPVTARPAPAELTAAERELRREGFEPRRADPTPPAPAPARAREPTPPGISDLQRIEDYRPVGHYRPEEIDDILGD